MFHLIPALERVIARGGSDLHIKAGSRPLIRINGMLDWLDPDADELDSWDTEKVLHDLLSEARIKEFEERHELDCSYLVPGLSSFRVNAYMQRGTVAIVMRVIANEIPTVAKLGLPDVVTALAEEERGLVIVTGATGCGKSTTLAAMIGHINATRRKHIVTIEDPVEYLHEDVLSSIDQREVGTDTQSFALALRQVLRQDPDVILVGEMRDKESVRTALSAAETGHLVLATLHTVDATETINRLLDFFPDGEQQQIRALISGTLKGIISQRLVAAADTGGRTAIAEVLTMTNRARDMIIDPRTTDQLADVIKDGEYYGMQTFDQAFYAAVKRGAVDLEEALRHATSPHDLKLLIAAEGKTRTSMSDVPATLRGV
ncbi:MAG: twitching motility protein PilT [Solirubrobacteraceae bacterium]|jgi:twitching motility protein PilT|nr:twitching motility protein PilT [Solirubrobacteraceae bacterium]